MIHIFSLYSCLYLMAKRLLLLVVSDKICLFPFFLSHIECTVKIGFDIVPIVLLYTGIRHNLCKYFMFGRRTL